MKLRRDDSHPDEPPGELTTADLARDAERTRARGDDDIIGREDVPRAAAVTTPPMADAQAPARRHQENVNAPPAARSHTGDMTPLFPAGDVDGLRTRWTDIQAGFVDEPRRAVEQADALVAETMKRLAEIFAAERSGLEKQWDRGDRITTEDLRIALQRYRSFFDRLLSL
jgi:hypothetical protein